MGKLLIYMGGRHRPRHTARMQRRLAGWLSFSDSHSAMVDIIKLIGPTKRAINPAFMTSGSQMPGREPQNPGQS